MQVKLQTRGDRPAIAVAWWNPFSRQIVNSKWQQASNVEACKLRPPIELEEPAKLELLHTRKHSSQTMALIMNGKIKIVKHFATMALCYLMAGILSL